VPTYFEPLTSSSPDSSISVFIRRVVIIVLPVAVDKGKNFAAVGVCAAAVYRQPRKWAMISIKRQSVSKLLAFARSGQVTGGVK
jgi:hypothetical protein